MSDARRIQDRLTEAVRARDIDGMIACYHPDAVVIAPEGTFQGTEEFAAFVRAQFEAFPDLEVAVHTKLDAGDVALDEATVSGTHTGPLALPNGAVVEPTGKRVTQRTADAAVVRDGRVAEHRFYYDQLEVLAQLELNDLNPQQA